MSPRRPTWLLILAASLLAAPGAGWAAVSVTTALPAFTAPFSNAVTAWGTASSLSVTVTNTGTQVVHRLGFQLPNSSYLASSGTPPGATWTASVTSSGGVGVIQFTDPCTGAGLKPGTAATFVLNLVTPQGATTADTTTSPFSLTASTKGTGGGCGATATGTASFTAAVKALYLTGTAAPAQGLGAPMTGVVTWSVTNKSSVAQASLTVVPVISPGSGATGSCTTLGSLASQATGTVTCTYTLSSPGTTFTFTANARNGAGTATAVGASAGTITVGSSSVAWTKAVMARGRAATYTLGFKVQNSSGTTVSRVDLTNPSSTGFTVSAASATGGLAYAAGSSTAADLVFTGSLAAGASATVSVTFSAVPAVASTTSYAFGVALSPAAGAAYAMTTSRQVVLVVPISEVAGLTIRANAAGQALAWTNTSAHGSTHDGVVIFRSAAGTVPATPADFTAYAAGTGGVVLAEGAGGAAAAFADASAGSYNYRVCNRDAYYVYSDCNTGFWNNAGWLDTEAYPAGGWVHAVGGSALLRPGFFPGSRFGLANNGPTMTVLDVATGARAYAPVSLTSLPSVNTPGVLLSNGRRMLYSADQSGGVTAVDIDTGAIVWQVTMPGASFTAGVAGIVRWSASAAFSAAYPMDVLLLGSTTGTVYAVDTLTGATLWSLAAGAGIFALITYDPVTNIFYVPTAGAGVKAYALSGSSPAVAPAAAPGWRFPDATGNYRVNCVRTASSAGLACVNTSGVIWIVDKSTGALQAPAFTSSVASPAGLYRVDGSAATPGLAVTSASRVQVLAATGTPYTVTSLGTWAPGLTLSTPGVYANSGYLVVGASDRRLHRVALASATQQAQSQQVGTQSPSLLLGQPAFDTATQLYLFGTSDGHIWALPSF